MLFTIALAVGGAVWLAFAGYPFLLAVAAAVRRMRRRRAAQVQKSWPRLAVLVPAHNEELVLAATVDRLRQSDYPADRWDAWVVADNCTDGTADVAAAHGAKVLERENRGERGKGYALAWATPQILAHRGDGAGDEGYAAIAIVDADTLVEPDFLRETGRGLATGHPVVQGYYGVLNAGDSWRTRLMDAALALNHQVKPLGRAALGLSVGLKGNGMAFSRAALEAVPWSGDSIVEDAEYTHRLLLAGFAPRFVPEARVWAQMPPDAEAARSQRLRWEAGRYQLLRQRGPQLIAASLRRRSAVLCDAAADLVIPPLAELALGSLFGTLLAGAWFIASGAVVPVALWSGAFALVLGYVLLGWWVARLPLRSLGYLAWAPVYVAWKLGLYAASLLGRSRATWTRTARRPIAE